MKILQELRAELVEREKLLRAKLEGLELAIRIMEEACRSTVVTSAPE